VKDRLVPRESVMNELTGRLKPARRQTGPNTQQMDSIEVWLPEDVKNPLLLVGHW